MKDNHAKALRTATLTFSAVALTILSYSPAFGATPAMQMKRVRFMKRDIRMAGNLYVPPGFNANGKYAAIVVVHPGGGVKEQTAGLYAEKLAGQGFVALAFDAAHQGESGGEPRLLEDPMSRVDDVSSAVDYLTTLAYVDANRIGAKAKAEKKELFLIDGATHMDLYAGARVAPVMQKLSPFFKQNLGV